MPIELLLWPSWGDDQLTNGLLLVGKRYRLHGSGGFTPNRDWLLLVSGSRQPDGDMGYIKQMGNGLHKVRQDGAWCIGRLQVVRQARQYSRRVVSLAIQQPIDAALYTISQGLEQHRDDSCGDQAA